MPAPHTADSAISQVLGDLNLESDEGPTNVDRPHMLSLAASHDVPRTKGRRASSVFQVRSSTPFSLIDSSTDLDRNGQTANEYLPAGTCQGTGEDAVTADYKGGRNGAWGPAYASLDVRAGYGLRFPGGRTRNAFVDMFNATNELDFASPTNATGIVGSDRRIAATFRTLKGLVNGVARTLQPNMRFGF